MLAAGDAAVQAAGEDATLPVAPDDLALEATEGNLSLQVVGYVDQALLLLGAVAAVGFAAWLVRRGKWRDPLADVAGSGGGPLIVHVLAVVLVFGLAFGISSALIGPADLDADLTPGTDAWHRMTLMDASAKLAAAVAISVVLWRRRSFTAAARPSVPKLAGVSVVAWLVILAVTSAQYHMTAILFRWRWPEWEPSAHTILEALQNTAWGAWGRAYLVALALVVAPLAEELFFRGLLLQALWRGMGHKWLAVTGSGILFGLIHLAQPEVVPALIGMGLVLGYVRLATRSLGACIAIHLLFNARTILIALLFPELAENL